MLTRELAIVSYDRGKVIPDRLTRMSHAAYLPLAKSMLEVYQQGIGKSRQSLHDSIRRLFPETEEYPPRRILAFCKLLDDVSEYDNGDGKKTAELRMSVFRAAAKYHPLVGQRDALFESQESEVKRIIAREHGMDWPELHRRLYADLIEYHRLREFQGFANAPMLLARYNVAQVQVALFDAVQMSILAQSDFKAILRFAKLARLMHRITKRSNGYLLELDGPASLLQNTHRYGLSMAKFLPGLLSCKGWSMVATIRTRFHQTLRLELDDRCGLTSQATVANAFDSTVEQLFCLKWGETPREGWTLERETEILHRGQTAFFPDFTFVHESGLRVMMEVIGFWTPEYLAQKSTVLNLFRDQPILLVVAQSLKEKLAIAETHPMVVYKTSIPIEPVLKALEVIRYKP
jgi:predicted nuclease of restriction endonuclease-like RecB superfamily